MLQDYSSVVGAQTVVDLQRSLEGFTDQFGFQFYGAAVVLDRPSGDAEFIAVDNPPDAYRAAYEDLGLAKRDPVMQHCKVSSTPIVWNQQTYVQGGEAEKWEMQAQFGYRCGITLAMHLPRGRHFVMGMQRDQALSTDESEIARLTSSFALLVLHTQEVTTQLLSATRPEASMPTLTPRELETLRWTLEGKTAWEVGRILNIAENTVIRHGHSATQKLGCANKHHAAVKALRLGLIH